MKKTWLEPDITVVKLSADVTHNTNERGDGMDFGMTATCVVNFYTRADQ